MAVDIETIGVEFDTSGLLKGQRELKNTERAANNTADAADNTGRRFSALSSAASAVAATLATLAVGLLGRQFVQTADAVALMNARLKLAAGGAADFAQAQQEIYRIAQANNVGLNEAATLYTRMADPVKKMGGGVKETAAIVDAFATSLRVSGASSQEASAATLQFAQAMGSGKLAGDEFRSMAETSPRFMKALADGLGVPIGKLKEMAANGELAAGVVGNALIGSLGKLKSEAAGLPDTVGGAFTRIKNDWLLAVDEINKESGLTGGLTDVLEVARKLIPTIKDELAGAFSAVGSFIRRNKETLVEVWEAAAGLLGDVWEIAKGFVGVAAGIVDVLVQTGLVQKSLTAVRYLIAGLRDGVKILGAAFAALGSLILKVVLHPMQLVLTASAKLAGVFDDALATRINGINSRISEFAGAGGRYAKEVVSAFASGDTAFNRLSESLEKTKNATDSANVSAKNTAETYKKLVDPNSENKGNKTTGKTAAQKLAEDAQRFIDKLREEVETFGLAGAALVAYQAKKAGFSQQVQAEAIALAEKIDAMNAEKKAAEEYARLIDRLMGDVGSLRDQTQAQKEYNERLGLSKEAITELDAAKLESMAVDKERLAVMYEISDITGVATHLLREQAATLRERAQLMRQGAVTEAIIEEQRKIAEASQKVWDNFAENVQRNLGDGLYNIMQGNFKGIANGFKAMMDRMVADALAARLSEKMFGAKGTSGGGLFGGILNSVIGWMGFGGSGAAAATGWTSGYDLPSMDGGGFTGNAPRAGGIDGRGGFPAILHPRETVIDHTKPGSKAAAPNVNINQTNNFTLSGPVTRETQMQIAAAAAQGIQRARRNL